MREIMKNRLKHMEGKMIMCNPYSPKIFKNKVGEGNGTPLQYSCLENPMDGGAW